MLSSMVTVLTSTCFAEIEPQDPLEKFYYHSLPVGETDLFLSSRLESFVCTSILEKNNEKIVTFDHTITTGGLPKKTSYHLKKGDKITIFFRGHEHKAYTEPGHKPKGSCRYVIEVVEINRYSVSINVVEQPRRMEILSMPIKKNN